VAGSQTTSQQVASIIDGQVQLKPKMRDSRLNMTPPRMCTPGYLERLTENPSRRNRPLKGEVVSVCEQGVFDVSFLLLQDQRPFPKERVRYSMSTGKIEVWIIGRESLCSVSQKVWEVCLLDCCHRRPVVFCDRKLCAGYSLSPWRIIWTALLAA
jgi:hypothetical protein